MPLQNRVDPFGRLFADSARGTSFGNRGGRFHRDDRTLGARRFVSQRWICCRLDFKGRRRQVWSRSYTELFFLDEVTALAAGHRPCFECRRADAISFAQAWASAHRLAEPPGADAMDRVIHRERIEGTRNKRRRMAIDTLPDGVMVTFDGDQALVRHAGRWLWWTPRGYECVRRAPRETSADLLTPPSVVAVLAAGYRPLWHPSADT
jgi:hypothetical protein